MMAWCVVATFLVDDLCELSDLRVQAATDERFDEGEVDGEVLRKARVDMGKRGVAMGVEEQAAGDDDLDEKDGRGATFTGQGAERVRVAEKGVREAGGRAPKDAEGDVPCLDPKKDPTTHD